MCNFLPRGLLHRRHDELGDAVAARDRDMLGAEIDEDDADLSAGGRVPTAFARDNISSFMPTDAPSHHAFTDALKRGLYEAIFRRRDIREFLSDPIPDDALARVLIAAHHAASVGFTQPWDFILVRSVDRRRRVKEIFEAEHAKNAAQFTGERREKYLAMGKKSLN